MTLLIIIFLILLAGLITSAEISIIYFDTEDHEHNQKLTDNSVVKKIASFQQKIEKVIAPVQIITTLCIVAAAILSGHYIENKLLLSGVDIEPIRWTLLVITVVIISIIYLTLVLLIPRAIGIKYHRSLAPKLIWLISFFSLLLYYPQQAIVFLANIFLFPFKTKAGFSHSHSNISEDELRVIISEGLKTGAIDETEHEFIENVLEFNDLRANEVMIPRTEMVAVEICDDNDTMFDEILKTGHTLIPIFKDSFDNILGIIHIKDMMRTFAINKKIDIKNLIRPAYFVPETKHISGILKEMQKRGERLAVVTDEYGGTEGVITLEDILSEIVGDFSVETDPQLKEYSKLPENKYAILGTIAIDDFNDTFNFSLPVSEEYNTVAGFISFQTGKILNVGEKYVYGKLEFELIKKVKQKMVQFKVSSSDNNLSELTGD